MTGMQPLKSVGVRQEENRGQTPESVRTPLSFPPDAGQVRRRKQCSLPQKTKKQNNDKDRERRENTFSFSVRNMQPQQAAESEENNGTGYGL